MGCTQQLALLAKLSKQMKHDEFIKHVQSAAQFNSREEAGMLPATLEALKNTSWGNEANQLAAQLPELGQYLRGREGKRSILSPRRVYSACE